MGGPRDSPAHGDCHRTRTARPCHDYATGISSSIKSKRRCGAGGASKGRRQRRTAVKRSLVQDVDGNAEAVVQGSDAE
jgi:hypothetical protein